MKLFNEKQLQEAYNRGYMDGRLNNIDYSITDGFKPIELPSDEDIEKLQEDNDNYDDYDFYDTGFKQGVKWMKEQILNQNK